MSGSAGGPMLSRATVARHAERRDDPAWLSAAWSSPRGRVLQLDPDGALPVVGDPPELRLLPAGEVAAAPPPEAFYLGSDDAADYFAMVAPPAGAGAGGEVGAGRSLRELGALLADRDAGLAVHAVALAAWHATHRHCPRCGAATVPAAAGHARRCPVDASSHFPRTDPAVIMLVTDPDGERAVLGRQPSWPAGRLSCLAGFVEAGESAEQAVVREVAEEVGLAAHDVRWRASQPWPFPASLMLAFTAVAAVEPVRLLDGELAEARWLTRQEVAAIKLPPPTSVARWLIDSWLAG